MLKAACWQELYLMDMVQSGQPAGGRVSLNLIQQALPHLVPLLTVTLTKRQSEDDDDTWNLAMAAGTCLALVAQVVGDGCVDLVLQFVTVNFTNQDWKYREAAVLAYGSIMEGPTSEKMRPMVEQSLSHLVMALQDPSVAVRDSFCDHFSIFLVNILVGLFAESFGQLLFHLVSSFGVWLLWHVAPNSGLFSWYASYI